MTIDFREDDVAKRLLKAIGAELSEFCDLHHMKHIVQVTAVRCDGREAMMLLRLIQVDEDSAKSGGVLSKEGDLYSRFCHRVNMRPEWLYKSFREGHHDYEVWGLVPLGAPLNMDCGDEAGDAENPHLLCEGFVVVCRRDDGLVYLYPSDTICEKMEGGAA